MRHILRALLCFVLLWMFAADASGQKPKPSPESPPEEESGLELLTLIKPQRLLASRSVGRANVAFYEDSTTAEVKLPEVYRRRKVWISMNASFTLAGSLLTEPKSVRIVFAAPPNSLGDASGLSLSAVADGKRFDLGRAKREVDPEVRDEFRRAVPFGTYKTIVDARSVRLRLGATDIVLKEDDLKSLRDLYKTIGTDPPVRKF